MCASVPSAENSRYAPDNASPFDAAAELNRDQEFCCLLDLTQSGVGINMVTHSGMGRVRGMIQRTRGVASASLSVFETDDSAVDNDGIYIRDNVFYKSAFALFALSEYHLGGVTPVNALPVFSGNTYVQYGNKPLLQKNRSTIGFYPSEETMKDILGDENGRLVIIGK